MVNIIGRRKELRASVLFHTRMPHVLPSSHVRACRMYWQYIVSENSGEFNLVESHTSLGYGEHSLGLSRPCKPLAGQGLALRLGFIGWC